MKALLASSTLLFARRSHRLNKLLIAVACLSSLSGSLAFSQENSKAIYKDPNAPISNRVHDLLGQMTVEEKVAQLESNWTMPAFPGFKAPSPFEGDHLNEAIVKKMAANGLGTFAQLDEFTGTGGPANPRLGAKKRNLLQEWVVKNTRLGIPIMFHGEALHGAVVPGGTSFPQAVGLGSTWDPELLQKMFTTVALESRAAGNALVLAPVLDLSRDPRYGRVEEMYSEDPFLVGQLGTAAVKGLQGLENDGDRLDDNHVYATLKHFVHGQPENGTNVGPSDYSERTMRSVFLYLTSGFSDHCNSILPCWNSGSSRSSQCWRLQPARLQSRRAGLRAIFRGGSQRRSTSRSCCGARQAAAIVGTFP
jgi:beta-glucosidase